jgi:hypothetical protein
LPVLHAISGCDTTSHIIGISKSAALKNFLSKAEIVNHACEFLRGNNKEVIIESSEKILVALYGGLYIISL